MKVGARTGLISGKCSWRRLRCLRANKKNPATGISNPYEESANV